MIGAHDPAQLHCCIYADQENGIFFKTQMGNLKTYITCFISKYNHKRTKKKKLSMVTLLLFCIFVSSFFPSCSLVGGPNEDFLEVYFKERQF